MREHRNFSNSPRGISVIELLIVMAVVGVGIAALLSFGTFTVRTASLQKQTLQASFLAKEAVEALRNYRDNTGWDDDDPGDEYDGFGVVATGVPLHPALSLDTPPRWQLLSGSETIGSFTRDAVVEPVARDSSDNIVASGGTLDPNTKEIIVTVSWVERGTTRQLQAITYLTNWR